MQKYSYFYMGEKELFRTLHKNLIIMKKNILIVVLAISLISVSFYSMKENQKEPVIASRKVAQVAVIVKDIEKARKAWAQMLGMEAPEVSVAEGHFSRPTLYMGNPSDAKAKLAFLAMDNLQIELIQPLGGKSTWQEFLDKNGEGLHHIAFQVKNIDGVEKEFASVGMPTVMRGGWDGGAYSYIDGAKVIGCTLELLENYK
jgi:methylmalonyl-CoA/ethylmalonyl-CoA epimerase